MYSENLGLKNAKIITILLKKRSKSQKYKNNDNCTQSNLDPKSKTILTSVLKKSGS